MQDNRFDSSWRTIMSLFKRGGLVACVMLLMNGCYTYTLEEGRAMMAKYDIGIDNLGSAKVPDSMIRPLEAGALIGTWEGEYEELLAMTHCQTDGVYEFLSKINTSYTFKEDGTFTRISKEKTRHQGQYHESGTYEGKGRWRYSNGALDLVESEEYVFQYADTKRYERMNMYTDVNRRLQVYWVTENEIAIRYRTLQDLEDACLAEWTSRGSGYCRIFGGYNKNDGKKVVQSFITSNANATKGQFNVRKTQMSNFRRMGVRIVSSVITRPLETTTDMAQSIDDTQHRRARNAAELASKPPYRIIDLAREKGSEFAYAFTLELFGDASIQTFFGVQTVFANEVRAAYQAEYPNADASSLRVVVQPRLSNGKIVGRAEVLTITTTSLSYDAGTRRGKLSVRFNPGQAEEARAWVRKNIETLVQDKNIALTTGQLPPAATYYSLGERINGNVMEIEFKTE